MHPFVPLLLIPEETVSGFNSAYSIRRSSFKFNLALLFLLRLSDWWATIFSTRLDCAKILTKKKEKENKPPLRFRRKIVNLVERQSHFCPSLLPGKMGWACKKKRKKEKNREGRNKSPPSCAVLVLKFPVRVERKLKERLRSPNKIFLRYFVLVLEFLPLPGEGKLSHWKKNYIQFGVGVD